MSNKPIQTTSTTAITSQISGEKHKLKVTVRCLPAQITEEIFKTSIEKWMGKIDFMYFVPGKISSSEKKVVDARAYLHFKDSSSVQDFLNRFHGHIFVTNKGKEQRAFVEHSPFQRIPRANVDAPNPDDGTIESDPEFVEFMQKLKEPIPQLPSAEEQLDKRLAEEKEKEKVPETTPLLEFLKHKRTLKKSRGERGERRKRSKDSKDKKEERKKRDKRKDERRKRKKDPTEKKGRRYG